jgi:hypothetical protein
LLGQHAPGEGAQADREQEAPLVDRHRTAAPGRCGDVGQHDLTGGEDESRPRTGHEPGADEDRIVRGVRAEEIAGGRHEPPERERRPPAEAVGELAHRHRHQEPRQSVDGDG